jgi:hypothetical protein
VEHNIAPDWNDGFSVRAASGGFLAVMEVPFTSEQVSVFRDYDSSAAFNPVVKAPTLVTDGWQLVLQIDNDCEVGPWGNDGRIYVCIRSATWRKARFDCCWMLLQCT